MGKMQLSDNFYRLSSGLKTRALQILTVLVYKASPAIMGQREKEHFDLLDALNSGQQQRKHISQ